MAESVDIAIIGGGPGGYVAAIRAAQLGARVACIEKDGIGGVCVLRGCIPTKALLHTAGLLAEIRRAERFGIHVENVSLNLEEVMSHKKRVVQRLTGGASLLLRTNGVLTLNGRGQFLGSGRIEVQLNDGSTTQVQADKIVIATGSLPKRLPVPGLEHEHVMDSDGALELAELPRRMLIIGGGPEGAEFATIFGTFGTEVTLVEMLPQLVPTEDADVAQVIESALKGIGVRVHTGTTVSGVRRLVDGRLAASLSSQGSPKEEVEVDRILVAVGRQPNTDGLGLDRLGVQLDPKGWIKVNERMETNVPGVYAIGDVVGPPLLAHVASHEGIVAVENARGEARSMSYRVVPAAIFTHPEIGRVGITERDAQQQGLRVRIGKFPFAANGRAVTMSQTEGFVKIVADARTDEVLGLQVVGPNASELIPEAAIGMTVEATLEEIHGTIHTHPTLSEAVAEAALAALGRVLHMPKPR